MKIIPLVAVVAVLLTNLQIVSSAHAQDLEPLQKALSFHASFDQTLDAEVAQGDKVCYIRQGADLVPFVANEEVKLVSSGGRFGGYLWFPKKGNTRPQYKGSFLKYNNQSWNGAVSVWLQLDPDKDLQPGYCDPVQIIGDDNKKGYIFLEWSKDETPRFFRYAIRPLFHIWNPTNVQWADIPFEKRPMVQVDRPIFSRTTWTHVVFTYDGINDKTKKQYGKLYVNGQLQGSIHNWDLTFQWDPSKVALVLGAAYVGNMDDLAAFNRALTDAEIRQLFELKNGVRDLR